MKAHTTDPFMGVRGPEIRNQRQSSAESSSSSGDSTVSRPSFLMPGIDYDMPGVRPVTPERKARILAEIDESISAGQKAAGAAAPKSSSPESQTGGSSPPFVLQGLSAPPPPRKENKEGDGDTKEGTEKRKDSTSKDSSSSSSDGPGSPPLFGFPGDSPGYPMISTAGTTPKSELEQAMEKPFDPRNPFTIAKRISIPNDLTDVVLKFSTTSPLTPPPEIGPASPPKQYAPTPSQHLHSQRLKLVGIRGSKRALEERLETEEAALLKILGKFDASVMMVMRPTSMGPLGDSIREMLWSMEHEKENALGIVKKLKKEVEDLRAVESNMVIEIEGMEKLLGIKKVLEESAVQGSMRYIDAKIGGF